MIHEKMDQNNYIIAFFIIDKLLVKWRYTAYGGKTEVGQICRGIETRRENEVSSNIIGGITLQDIPEYLESSLHYQIPDMVSVIAINIT